MRAIMSAKTIFYQLSFENALHHEIDVTITVPLGDRVVNSDLENNDKVVFSFPRWTPGWYTLQENSKNLLSWQATDENDDPLTIERISHFQFAVIATQAKEIKFSYTVYARRWSDDACYLDEEHCSILGTSLFMSVERREDRPCQLHINKPEKWNTVTCGMKQSGENQWLAADFHELVDMPIEIGNQAVFDFKVKDKPHQLAVVGQGSSAIQWHDVIQDVRTILEKSTDLMGSIPYEKYVVILHLTPTPTGSLEHRNSTSLTVVPWRFLNERDYKERFLSLVAHEYFHLWNVKRIRPRNLVPLDYSVEQHTELMWFFEGFTSYVDLLIVRLSGLIDAKEYLKYLSVEFTNFLKRPGRHHQTLADSSFDAWVKFNHGTEKTANTEISFYNKGSLVGLLLDLQIRFESQGAHNLFDVFKALFAASEQDDYKGLTEADFVKVVQEVTNVDVQLLIRNWVHTTQDLHFPALLKTVGLELEADNEPDKERTRPKSWLGVTTKVQAGKLLVATVNAEGPAWSAGLAPGDELIAYDGARIRSSDFSSRVADMPVGHSVNLTIARHERLRKIEVTLLEKPAQKWKLSQLEDASDAQKAAFAGWLEAAFDIASDSETA